VTVEMDVYCSLAHVIGVWGAAAESERGTAANNSAQVPWGQEGRSPIDFDRLWKGVHVGERRWKTSPMWGTV